jgi:hypothetical protein
LKTDDVYRRGCDAGGDIVWGLQRGVRHRVRNLQGRAPGHTDLGSPAGFEGRSRATPAGYCR